MERVLVVDDEPYLAELVATALRYEGFTVATAGTVAEAQTKVDVFRPDLVVLDVMLPDQSGLDWCQGLRQNGYTAPIVFLTARQSVRDKVAGLGFGADDYLTKPFSLEELIARIRAVLRRTKDTGGHRQLVVADLEIDEEAYEVRRAGQLLSLTATEFALLRHLAVNAGRVLSKQQLLDQVWKYDFNGNDNVVHTYISYLRRKLGEHGPQLIQTLPRIGYVLRPPRDS